MDNGEVGYAAIVVWEVSTDIWIYFIRHNIWTVLKSIVTDMKSS